MAVLPALSGGGAEVQLAQLVRSLPKDAFDVQLVTLLSARVNASVADRLAVPDLPIHDLAVGDAAERAMGPRHFLRNLLRARPRLAARVRAFRPHVVYSRLWYAGLVVTSLDRASLDFRHVANEEASFDNPEDHGRAKQALRGLVVRRADHWVSPSRGLFQELVARGADPRRGHVIPNATGLPSRAATPKAAGGETRFAAMGRLIEAKGFDRLLDAASLLRADGVPFTVDVAGEGPERARLEARAHELGLTDTVRFVGFVADPLAFLQERDAFVLTSRSEGFANVLVEAMACQLPTVAFDIPHGPNEIVAHERSGLLVADGDMPSFVAAMRRLALHPQTRRALGEHGRERAEALFSVERVTSEFAELFTRAAEQPTGEGKGRYVRHSWKRA